MSVAVWDLPGAAPVDPGSEYASKLQTAFQKCPMNGRIEHLGTRATIAAFYDANRFLMADCLMVRPVVPQRIVNVANRDDTGLKRDLLPGEMVGVSAPVPILMMLECDHGGQAQHRMLAGGQNSMTPDWMLSDNGPFVIIQ